jgi:uncharacterized membrane protein YhaH (DUF805 family)
MSALGAGPSVRNRGLAGWWLPTGRIRRSDWWLWYFLVIVLLGLLASLLDGHFFPDSLMFEPDPDPEPERTLHLLVPLPETVGPVTGVTGVVLLVPNVAALATRLHDRDHSAWWLLWAVVPGIGALVLFVTIALLGTDPRPNRFGPPPV